MRPDGPRDPVVGPDSGPEPPFPLKLSGEVIKGFGRGSKELGIPTANIPIEGLSVGGHDGLESGVYFGWAGLDFHSTGQRHPSPGQGLSSQLKQASTKVADTVSDLVAGSKDDSEDEAWDGKGRVHPMVMSIGWNPYYKNEKRSVEVHIMHDFTDDFYGAHMNLSILGFIRPEYDYVSKEGLIDDIKTDVEVAGRSLARPAWAKHRKDKNLLDFSESSGGDSKVDGAAK